MWTRPGGIVDQTNAIFTKAGAGARLSVLNYNDATTLGDGGGPARQFGDIRYSFIRWESDLDTDSPFLGVDAVPARSADRGDRSPPRSTSPTVP